ncbi:hypothetical protein ACFL5Z_04735 [Planctomycetota bacterium]
MEQQIRLKQIEQKIFKDSQQDGLLELVMGLCMLAMSSRVFSRILVFMLALPVFAFAPLLAVMRKQFTYPRIGYVRPIPDKPKEIIGGIFLLTLVVLGVLALVFLFFGQVRDFDLWLRWCPFWGGTVLAGMFNSFASKSGEARYHVFALWSFVSGVVLSLVKFEAVETGTLLYFVAMGALLIPCGFVLFMKFLHRYPKVAEEL